MSHMTENRLPREIKSSSEILKTQLHVFLCNMHLMTLLEEWGWPRSPEVPSSINHFVILYHLHLMTVLG